MFNEWKNKVKALVYQKDENSGNQLVPVKSHLPVVKSSQGQLTLEKIGSIGKNLVLRIFGKQVEPFMSDNEIIDCDYTHVFQDQLKIEHRKKKLDYELNYSKHYKEVERRCKRGEWPKFYLSRVRYSIRIESKLVERNGYILQRICFLEGISGDRDVGPIIRDKIFKLEKGKSVVRDFLLIDRDDNRRIVSVRIDDFYEWRHHRDNDVELYIETVVGRVKNPNLPLAEQLEYPYGENMLVTADGEVINLKDYSNFWEIELHKNHIYDFVNNWYTVWYDDEGIAPEYRNKKLFP